MKQKIEWYQEVLEIDPDSRIFFPLAKMLVRDGREDKAVLILQQGVERHPEYIEARLFLVELLLTRGPQDILWKEVDAVGTLFSEYPSFWQAWGQRLRDKVDSRDAGLALMFLAALLRHERLSWTDVIEHGLHGVLNQERQREKHPPIILQRSPSPERVADESEETGEEEEETSLVPEKLSVRPDDAMGGSDDEEQEEPFSLRTRSMAEVLAEQGDIDGALEIYQELLASATPGQDCRELQARRDELTRLQTASPRENSGVEAGVSTEQGTKSRLTDMLEALAQRLESRSLQ
jgi:tetratricopeptide (TPR) repeat protein